MEKGRNERTSARVSTNANDEAPGRPGEGSPATHGTGAVREPLRNGPSSDTPWSQTRVTKTLWPPSPGTRRLRAAYGAALVCVRYRHDRDGHYRYTTVELMIDHAPVRHREDERIWLSVRVPRTDATMRARIAAAGGKWQHASATWLITRKAALALKLERHVVATPSTKPKRNGQR